MKIDHMGDEPIKFVFEEIEDEDGQIPTDYDYAIGNFLSLPKDWHDGLRKHLWDFQDVVYVKCADL